MQYNTITNIIKYNKQSIVAHLDSKNERQKEGYEPWNQITFWNSKTLE